MDEHEDTTLTPQPLGNKDRNPGDVRSSGIGRNFHTYELNLSWDSISELGILAKTCDNMPCGKVISTYKDNIIVMDFGIFGLLNGYMIPISRIKAYDGKYIYLSIPDEANLQPYVY